MLPSQPITQKSIPVTVDKSHLLTIGEKLYTEKTSFIRELVNNAFDADATQVQIEITPTTITISDNGVGMDEEGLHKYFTIGGSEKKSSPISPRLGRTRIGEFGIGKFAALAACKQFDIETQRGQFHATLTFNKEKWSSHEDWHLDIDVLPFDPQFGNGTTITLCDLQTTFVPGKVRRYLAERAPIQVSDFAVWLNGERVSDEVMTGRHLPVDVKTPYGNIEGTLVITPADRRATRPGIAVLVKNILVCYENFILDSSRKWGATRIIGKINANFLPITSSRDSFIRDSAEFICFVEAMRKEIKKALALIREEGDRKANLQSSRVLKDALQKIGRAMKMHEGIFPGASVPLGVAADTLSGTTGYDVSQAEFIPTQTELDPNLAQKLQESGNKKRIKGRPQAILGNKSVIRTLRVANMDIAVRLEHLGDQEESLIAGGVIYVNIDHPLYLTYQENDELLTFHLARVITKELTLQAGILDAPQAFALQADLLTSALKGKRIK